MSISIIYEFQRDKGRKGGKEDRRIGGKGEET